MFWQSKETLELERDREGNKSYLGAATAMNFIKGHWLILHRKPSTGGWDSHWVKKKKGLGSTLYFEEENFAVRLCRFNEHINLDGYELFSPFLGVTSGWTIKFLERKGLK